MSSRFRVVLKDFAVYGTGEVLVRALSVLTVPIYAHIFAPDDYGVLSYLWTLVGLVGAVLILGGDSAYARFYYEARTPDERAILTSTWIGFLTLVSVLVTAVVLVPASGLVATWSFGDATHAGLVIVAFAGVPIGGTNAMLAQVLRNEFRPRAYTVLNISYIVLNVALGVIFVVVARTGLIGVLLGTAVAGLLLLPIRIWTIRHLLTLKLSRRLLRRLLSYGLPLVPTSLAYWVFLTSDRLVLGKLSTLTELGWYSVAVSLSGLLGLASNALASAWTPRGTQAYEDDRPRAAVEYGRIMTYLLFGMGVLGVSVTVFAPELLRILTRPAFYPAAQAVGPLAFAMIAYTSVQVTAAGITLTKKTKYLAIFSWAAAVLNVALNVAWDRQFGMMGAAWATTAAYLFLTLAYLMVSQNLWAVAYEVRRNVVLIGLVIAFMVGASWTPSDHSTWALLVKGLYCAAFVATSFALRGLDRRELSLLQSFLPRKAE